MVASSNSARHFPPKRPSTAGKHDAGHSVHAAAANGLKDGTVLAVDGYKLAAVAGNEFANPLPGHHERFLIGEGNRLTGLKGGPCAV